MKLGVREKPVAAILKDDIPVRGAAANPQVIARVLSKTHRTIFVTAAQLADPNYINRAHFDLVVLPYGESFPLAAWSTVQSFLTDGGDLLTTGGYAFRSPVVKKRANGNFTTSR